MVTDSVNRDRLDTTRQRGMTTCGESAPLFRDEGFPPESDSRIDCRPKIDPVDDCRVEKVRALYGILPCAPQSGSDVGGDIGRRYLLPHRSDETCPGHDRLARTDRRMPNGLEIVNVTQDDDTAFVRCMRLRL